MKTAIVGGGCFWCLEAIFQRLRGVSEVRPGYCGGHLDAPNYAVVCAGDSGHAEVVEITYDAEVIPYATLLSVFFSIHDPTTSDRQGADIGSQYRSVIVANDEEEYWVAQGAILHAQIEWGAPIVTEILRTTPFFPAESYHHRYYDNHADAGYCAFVIAPKLAKAAARFGALLHTPLST